MLQKLFLAFAVLAIVIASAGTVPAPGGTYKLMLLQPSVVQGKDLQAGEYRLAVGTSKVTIINKDKETVEVPVTVENVDKKFDTTSIRYSTVNGKANISEIRFGGTKTKLVFNP